MNKQKKFSFRFTPEVTHDFRVPPDFFIIQICWFNPYWSTYPWSSLVAMARALKQNKNYLRKGKCKFIFDQNNTIYYLIQKRRKNGPFDRRPSKGSFEKTPTALSRITETRISASGVKVLGAIVDKDRRNEDKKVSYNTTGWAKLPISKRRISFNPYHRRSDYSESSLSHIRDKKTGSQILTSAWRLIGSIPPATYATDVTGFVTRVQGSAITKARLQMKDSNVNLMNAIGEGKQTVQLLLTAIRRLTSFSAALRRKDFSSALQILRSTPTSFTNTTRYKNSIGDNILEIQYGWRPLVGDIMGFVEQLDKVDLPGRALAKGVAKDSDTIIVDSVLTQNSTYEKYLVGSIVREEHKIQVIGRSVVISKIENLKLALATGFGLTNPLALAWELTPWSFVVDWILPIGKMLDSLDASLGRKFIIGSDSWFYSVVSTRYIVQANPNYEVLLEPMVRRTTFHYRRSPRTSFPTPGLPRFKDPFSLNHFINSLALVDGRYGKKL